MINLKKFKDIYISETKELLEKIDAGILALEKNPKDKDLLDELMRFSHTMKSSAATMGYKNMSSLTHAMEDVFDGARRGDFEITTKNIDIFLKSVDSLEKSLVSINKSGNEIDLDQITNEIKESINAFSAKSKQGRKAIDETVEIKNIYAPAEQEKITHIKVPVERLDALLSLAEELVADKMKIERFENMNRDLKEAVNHFSRLVGDIRYQVMQARLLPVEQIFIRFPRMVRDLSQSEGKKIDFEISGGELELDRTIVDKLGEPLVHLIRNAVEHGIAQNGKIYLKALRQKEYAVIVVEDDGKGIDFEKVKQVAVKKNIITPEEALLLEKKEIMNLLFHPHMSTKDYVTEVSGRGVGLSVVKNFADQIGGRVIIDSPIKGDSGTRFTLELPLTLAIINALLVNVKESSFAIPFSNIDRSVLIRGDDVRSMGDQDVAVIDANHVPLVRLENIFNLNLNGKKPEGLGSKIAVLVEHEREVAGLVVDKLLGEQEIIIKPLPEILRGIKGFSGVTILGDGQTTLVLDIKSLLEDSKK